MIVPFGTFRYILVIDSESIWLICWLIGSWLKLKLVKEISKHETCRYSRHMILPARDKNIHDLKKERSVVRFASCCKWKIYSSSPIICYITFSDTCRLNVMIYEHKYRKNNMDISREENEASHIQCITTRQYLLTKNTSC